MSVFEDTASASFEVCRVNKGTKFGKGGSTFRLHDFFGKTGDENEFYRSLDRLEAAAKMSSYIQSSYEETVGDMLKKLTLALDGEIDKVMEQWDNEGNETEKQVPTFGLNFGAMGHLESEFMKTYASSVGKRKLRRLKPVRIGGGDDSVAITRRLRDVVLKHSGTNAGFESDSGVSSSQDEGIVKAMQDMIAGVLENSEEDKENKSSSKKLKRCTKAELTRKTCTVFLVEGCETMPAKKLREIVLCAIAMQREQSVILVLGLSENDSQFLGLDDILQPCVMDMLNVVSVSVPLMHSKLLKNDGNLSNQDQDFSSMMFIGPEGLKLVRSIYRNVDHSASLLKERTRLMTLLAMSRRPETALRFIQPKGKECVFSKEDCEVFENLESRKQLPESKIEMGKSLALACAKFDHWMLEWTSAMRIFYRLTIPTQTSATPKIPFSDFLSNALAKDPLTENNGEKLQRLKADVTKKTSFDDLIAVLDSALSDACRLKRKTKQTESPRLQRQERCLKFAIESLEKARDLKKDSSPVTEISDFVEDAAIAINSEDEENITTPGKKSSRRKKQLNVLSRFELQKALREQVQEEGKENKGVELQAREEVATAVVELLRAFPHPSTFPWREVFVTGKSETEVMRDMAVLFGDSAIIQALGDPGSVLQCECCQRTAHADEQDEGAVIGSMPDICIAYQLLCEYQVHRISLRDWLYQFDEALRSSGSTKAASKSEALEEPSATVQARFSQAVAELELLGIIVPAARPPDHMERIY